MKITGVKVTRRFDGARARCIVQLLTDTGLTGIGIADARSGPAVRRLVTGMLAGADPRSVTGIWQQMADAAPARGAASLRQAMAVLDVALWDLKAKANGEPLWKTLGGARPRANAYASSVGLALDEAQLSAWYLRMAGDYGLRGGKLQAGRDMDENLRRVGRMRTALERAASEPVLMIDAARCWPPGEAIGKLRLLEEEFDLCWVEGASRDRDVRGLKRVSDGIRGAVCVGAGFATVGDYQPHFQHRSADIVQIDINAIGITGALQVADAAFGLELPVTLAAAPGNMHAHLAGVMPGFMSVAITDPDPRSQVLSSDVRIEGGWAVAGDAPGNGLAPT